VNTILERLQKRFPDMWLKEGYEFNGGGAAVAWAEEGATLYDHVLQERVSAFDYYSTNYNTYEMGVHVDLVAFCQQMKCHWECHDAGTYLLYED